MKEFTVYGIKEEFAKRYYYKSDILFRFLLEYHRNPSRHDLQLQYHFITESFPRKSLSSQLIRQPKNTFHRDQKGEMIELGNSHNFIALHIYEKQIKFRCETLQDAEALLFASLRRFHQHIFIIEANVENYGWISPIRTNVTYNDEEVLYS